MSGRVARFIIQIIEFEIICISILLNENEIIFILVTINLTKSYLHTEQSLYFGDQ